MVTVRAEQPHLRVLVKVLIESEFGNREREMVMEGESETPRSPEAKLGMQVEDLWDIQEPQLSPTEKLNACFESIPVSAFPRAPSSQGNFSQFCF